MLVFNLKSDHLKFAKGVLWLNYSRVS